MRRTIARLLPEPIRRLLRPAARKFGLAAPIGQWDRIRTHIEDRPTGPRTRRPYACNICQWTGTEFAKPFHCEMADCPRCGSIARDRFLMLSFLARTPNPGGKRILETSPRLGAQYRTVMRRSFAYTASDFDLSAHRGDIRIDLQDIELEDASIDIVLTPHVLEHVPDTDRALREIARILSPGGRMYLQVPLTRGATEVPSTPEFHNDNTPVFFNFGWDLTTSIRRAGFDVRVLVTQEFHELLSDRGHPPVAMPGEFDLPSLWIAAPVEDLDVVADRETSHRLGFLPAHHYATWECIKQI